MNASNPTRIAWQRSRVLTASTIVLWVILAGPAYWLANTLGLEGVTYSALLCWLPGCVLFMAIPFFEFAKNTAFAFLAGSSLRMFVVLLGTLVIHQARAHLGLKEFLSWLVVFYSVTLLVETLLIVKSPGADTSSISSSSTNSVPS